MKLGINQQKKFDYLVSKGGKEVMTLPVIYVEFPDGSKCNIDPFGKVLWLKKANK